MWLQYLVIVCLLTKVHTQSTSGSDGSSDEGNKKMSISNSWHYRFDYIEGQLLQIIQLLHRKNEQEQESFLLLQAAANDLQTASQGLRCNVNDPAQDEVTTLKEQVASLLADVAALKTISAQLSSSLTGSVFTRWGNSSCPRTSESVYSGYVGGPLWSHTGSGSNLLCLPTNPVYDDIARTTCGPSTVYGVEYHVCPDAKHQLDAVCAVCRSKRSTTVMIPATNICPPGWMMEYRGHVMAGYGGYQASSDYVCIDEAMETRAGGDQLVDSQRLYYTLSMCGSLPCPPYQNEKILSCVVCSK